MGSVTELASGGYLVVDETDGGHITRGSHLIYEWETKWDENLNLLYLVEGKTNFLTDVVLNKQKDHEEYYRSIRTMNRHLKMLKDNLGIEYKKPKEKEAQRMFYIGCSMFNNLDCINKADVIVYDKQIKIGSRSSKDSKNAYKLTTVNKEKQKLVDEYNEKLKEFLLFREEQLNKIFRD